MDWNWACEQMLKGMCVKKRENWACHDMLHIVNKIDSKVLDVYNDRIDKHCYMDRIPAMWLFATDWELYQEPKKWTEEDICKAKAGIELGMEWVARDRYPDTAQYGLWMYKNKPTKRIDYYMPIDSDYATRIETHLFKSCKWEDTEPTRLQDIVDSEAQDEE